MPPDPNDKMDELLKAFAKTRREQTGAPFELDGATRSMLQAEVARRAPRAKEKGAKTPFLFRLLFTAAAAASIAICATILFKGEPPAPGYKALNAGPASVPLDSELPSVALSSSNAYLPPAPEGAPAAITAQPINGPSLASDWRAAAPTDAPDAFRDGVDKDASAKSAGFGGVATDQPKKSLTLTGGDGHDLRKIDIAVTLTAPTTPPGAVTIGSGTAQDVISNSLNGANISLNTSPNPSINNGVAGDTQQTPQPAPGGNMAMNANGSGGAPGAAAPEVPMTRQSVQGKITQNVTADAAAPAAAPPAGTLAGNNANAAQQNKGMLAKKEMQAQAEKMETFGVLTTFQLELEGDNVRLIDADGSIYSGKIDQPLVQKLLAGSNGRTFTNIAAGSQSGNSEKSKANFKTQQAFAGADGGSSNNYQEANTAWKKSGLPQQNFFFRAAGTSLKLNKPVVFEGNYIAADTAQEQQQLDALKAKESNNNEADMDKAASLPNNNARIQGQAQIGDNQMINIDAIAVPLKTKAGN